MIYLNSQQKKQMLEYNKVNDMFVNFKEFKFMNHGYFPIHKFSENSDCKSKYESSLYFYLLDFYEKNTSKIKILDVGCGRGGGIYYLNKQYNFIECYGIDYCQKSIDFCLKEYKNSKINFSCQNALNLNYVDNFFDIVINVESSHCYEDKKLFFDESFRILKNNGYFLYTDIVSNEIIAQKIYEYLNKKYKNVIVKDITDNVCQSCLNLKNTIQEKNMNTETFNYMKNIFESKYLLYKKREKLYYSYACFDKKINFSYS